MTLVCACGLVGGLMGEWVGGVEVSGKGLAGGFEVSVGGEWAWVGR